MQFFRPLKSIFFVLFFLSGFSLFYTQKSNTSSLSYKNIERKIDSLHNNPQKMWEYINLYIKKSKLEKNDETLLYAYRYASNYSTDPNNLKYADSALIMSLESGNKKLMGDAYINRGMVYMDESLFEKALDDILIANKFSNEIGNPYTIHKTIYYIAQNKIYLGQYEDANKELLKCIDFFRKNAGETALGKDYQTYYIYSLMSYIDSNTKIGKQNENEPFLKEAFNYIKKNNLHSYEPYFISSEGIIAYYNKDYKTAISKLSNAIKLYNDQWTHITEVYYIGMSHWNLGNKFAAVKYFEAIDKEYDKTKQLDPNFRSAYEHLIEYSSSIGDRDKQLEYIDKLMTLDSIYEKNFKYLYAKINKAYDTQALINEKAKVELDLKNEKRRVMLLFISAIVVLGFVGFRYFKLQKTYKERFEKIMTEENSNKLQSDSSSINLSKPTLKTDNEAIKDLDAIITNTNNNFYSKIPGINPTIVENTLNFLNDFEISNGFLDPNITQKMLSEKFGTNSSYLSKIMNTYKGKSFQQYINDLRLEYIVNLLKTDLNYLFKDVKELAYIAGFPNSENFSDNFQRKYELKPSYFIKKMQENVRTPVRSHNPTSDEAHS